MMPNEECLDAAADESLLETSPIQSPLQVFAGMGGLALIAERLPMLYPDVIQQVKLSAFKRHGKLEIEQLAYIQQFFSINFLFHKKSYELTCSDSSDALIKSLVCPPKFTCQHCLAFHTFAEPLLVVAVVHRSALLWFPPAHRRSPRTATSLSG